MRCSSGIRVNWTSMRGVEYRGAKSVDFLARGMSPFSLYTSHIQQMPDSYQKDKRNFWRAVLEVKEVSRYLSIILAGTFKLSWPGPAYWNPSSNATENAIPPLHYCSLPRNIDLIVFQQERTIYFIWKFGNW